MPLNVFEFELDPLPFALLPHLFFLLLQLFVVLSFLALYAFNTLGFFLLTVVLVLVLKAQSCALEQTSVHLVLRR